MGEIQKSETYSFISESLGKYKRFCFDAISKLPYASVPAWIAFSDCKMDEALKEKRSVWQSVKDQYVIWLLGILFAIIAFWILAAIFGGLLLSLFAIAAAAGLLVNPMLTIGIVLGILALILLAPGVFLLLRGALYHLLARFFGGKGSYAQTVDVLVKSSAAHLVLMIPLYIGFALIIGFVLSPLSYAVIFYSIYLTYRGLMHAHALPQKNAVITVVAGYVIEFGIGAVIVITMQVARVLMLLGRGG